MPIFENMTNKLKTTSSTNKNAMILRESLVLDGYADNISDTVIYIRDLDDERNCWVEYNTMDPFFSLLVTSFDLFPCQAHTTILLYIHIHHVYIYICHSNSCAFSGTFLTLRV